MRLTRDLARLACKAAMLEAGILLFALTVALLPLVTASVALVAGAIEGGVWLFGLPGRVLRFSARDGLPRGKD